MCNHMHTYNKNFNEESIKKRLNYSWSNHNCAGNYYTVFSENDRDSHGILVQCNR